MPERRLRAGRALRRSAVGVPVAMLGFGAVLWLLGLTPLPAAPATATDLIGMARRATVMGHGLPLQPLHLPRVAGWLRAHLPSPAGRSARLRLARRASRRGTPRRSRPRRR